MFLAVHSLLGSDGNSHSRGGLSQPLCQGQKCLKLRRLPYSARSTVRCPAGGAT